MAYEIGPPAVKLVHGDFVIDDNDVLLRLTLNCHQYYQF